MRIHTETKLWKKYGFLVLLVCTAIFLAACTRKNKGGRTDENAQVTEVPSRTATVVVTGKDEENRQLTVRELDYDVDTILVYDARAQVTDRFGSLITADDLEIGQLLEVQYATADARLITAAVPKDAWEYREVEKFRLDPEKSAMTLAGRKFQYGSQTFFASGEQSIDSIELNKRDILTVRGIGIKVYSVVRTRGHGYIRLKNYSDFVGGMISVGSQVVLPVTDSMLITARVGTYRVTLSKKSFSATKTAVVKDGEETVVDFSDYAAQVKDVGWVTFNIEPEGADLYINNTAVDYSRPVALNFGVYAIRVEMTGYTTYSGTFNVQKADPEVTINLATQAASVDGEATPNPTTRASEKPSDSGDADAPITTKIDSKHTIKITAPEGAEVYLDDVYKGMVPCAFTKVIGSQTITLSKTGYITKSYSIDVLDDDKNVTLSFAELAEDSD